MIKHLSFDLWGTLISPNPEYRKQRLELFNDVFDGDYTYEQITAGKRAVDYISEVSGIQLTYAQTLAICLGANMFDIPKNVFLEYTKIFEERNDKLMEEFHPQFLTPYIKEFLYELKDRGYSMNILSNTSIISGSSLRIALKKLDIDKFFEYMFFSDEMELAKPNPRFYNLIENIANKPHKHTLHIGDNSYSDSGGGVVKAFILSKKNTLSNLLKYLNKQ